jgi:CRP-like cAMP-binding protein
MSDKSIWFLENIDAQGIFCPKKLVNDNENHSHMSYKKGEFIFMANDKADALYFITSGRVKIGAEHAGEKSITKAILNPGEIFGEMAAVGVEKRRDYAQALVDTQVCVMTREVMDKLFIERHPFMKYILKLVGSRALEMEKRLESLVFKDSRSRIIEFLVDLTDKKGQRVGFEHVVRNFMTHQEIANLTATSRQTVTTLLNDLRSQNLITFDRRRLLIRDIDALTEMLKVKAE